MSLLGKIKKHSKYKKATKELIEMLISETNPSEKSTNLAFDTIYAINEKDKEFINYFLTSKQFNNSYFKLLKLSFMERCDKIMGDIIANNSFELDSKTIDAIINFKVNGDKIINTPYEDKRLERARIESNQEILEERYEIKLTYITKRLTTLSKEEIKRLLKQLYLAEGFYISKNSSSDTILADFKLYGNIIVLTKDKFESKYGVEYSDVFDEIVSELKKRELAKKETEQQKADSIVEGF